jgi:hypothetical protein
MSSPLSISGPVRRALGERTAAALDAGVGLPADAQCWGCGDAVNLLAAKPGSVTLSVVMVGPASITTFAHRPCGPSRTFTPEEYEAVASKAASPVTADSASDSALIVDGERLL